MNRRALVLVSLLVVGLLAGCAGKPVSGTGGSSSEPDRPAPQAASGDGSSGGTPPNPIASQPRRGTAPDRRIVVIRAREQHAFALVNYSHSRRRPDVRPDGPRGLALGGRIPNYNVISDSDFDELVRRLRDKGWNTYASPMKARDAELFFPDNLAQTELIGIMMLEENGQRTRMIGVRDGGLSPRLFRDMRAEFFLFHSRGKTETPGLSYVDRMDGA